METTHIDLSKLVKPFENKWVAFTPEYTKVVASGDTLDEVESQLDAQERQRMVFFKVPRFDAVFVPATV